MNLGAGYSADFEVFDRDFVLVAVGFGFYCQMTWREASEFCDSRVDLLERRKFRFNGKLTKIEEDLKVFNDLITKLSWYYGIIKQSVGFILFALQFYSGNWSKCGN